MTTTSTESNGLEALNQPLRVAVIGAAGKMGRTMAEGLARDERFELVACITRNGGEDIAGRRATASLEDVVSAGASVAVDLTVAEASRVNLAWLAANGVHAVVGTSGLDDRDIADLRAVFRSSNCVVAPNFAISAVLMMRFAELAAPWFDTAEIIEMHHENKIDAPSGTAVATAERMAAASTGWLADPTRHELLPGARGASGPGGVRIHALRMRGVMAHQQVVLGTAGQTLVLRQDTLDRTSYLPGVQAACLAVSRLPGVTVGLDAVLGV